MELFDSHAHLSAPQFDADRAEVIARARSAGVTRLLTCGSDLPSSRQEAALAAAHDGIYAAVGVHGHEAHSAVRDDGTEHAETRPEEAVFAALAELAAGPAVVAIGEIGLDYHYCFSPPEAQRAVLARQLALAVALDLPVILHNRESDEDMHALVDAAPTGLRGVLHCFLADASMAQWALDRGFYIGVAGPITFKNVRHLPAIVQQVPLERLLIETDCPYLAPHPKRGRRNEPAYVRYVAERLADILDISPDELAQRTTENACRLFGIS